MLDTIDPSSPLQGQLGTVHLNLRQMMPTIDRIAVAIFDRRSGVLKTFVHSTRGETPFVHYEAPLAEVPSLAQLARSGDDRVINDLAAPGRLPGGHDRQLLASGYRSSYTRPFYHRGELFGFVFFDSCQPHAFAPPVVRHLQVFAQLVSLTVVEALTPAESLRSAVEFARSVSRFRDEETGAHLYRMASYARLIAKTLAVQGGLDDEFVEFVFLFAPLHDVGKIAIPDRILLKPGRLDDGEFAIMQTHVSKGVEIVTMMAETFGIGSGQHVDVLRNIVAFHHEAVDGSGYLEGRRGADIPLEARIVTVADVFDALTTVRPYKRAWSNDEAFALLADLAGRKFDPDCVAALSADRPAVEVIQTRFRSAKGAFEGFHEAYLEEV